MSKSKIVILFSSLNPQGNTYQLVNLFMSALSDHQIVQFNLDTLEFAQYNYQNNYPNSDAFYELAQALDWADHIVFASPVYWSAVTDKMKKLVDRITELTENPAIKPIAKRLKGKHAWVLTTSASRDVCEVFAGFFTRLFHYFSMTHGGLLHINCREHYVVDEHAFEAFVAQFTRGELLA